MKIRIQRTDLLRALYRVQGIIDRKPTTRLGAHVLIEADADGILVSATDNDISLSGRYKAEVQEPGAITAHARQFYDIVRSLAAEDIDLASAPQQWLHLRCGNSEFRVAGGSSEEFPSLFEVESQDSMELSASTLLQMIDRTLFCVSSDENRHNLSGVFCEPIENDQLRMVSTDGHRLALAEGPTGGGKLLARGVLLPKRGLIECKRLLSESHGEGTVRLGTSEQGAVLRYGTVALTTRLIESAFPDYRQVIPQSSSKEAHIPRGAFIDATRRVSLLSQTKTWGVRLRFNLNELVLEAEDPEHGDARETLEIDYQGDPLSIGFNARYLLDVLALISAPRVAFCLTDEHSPGVLKPADDPSFVSIVMPMRV